MIGQLGIRLAIVFCVAATLAEVATAQAPRSDCRFYKVIADRLNAFDKPRGDAKFVVELGSNDIVCVTDNHTVSDRIWAYIDYKLVGGDQHKSVAGWAIMNSLQPAAQDEVTAVRSARRPAPSPAAAAPVGAAPPASTAPPPQAAPAAEAVVRFSDPITVGPVPVQGHSLEQLVKGIPAFPPLEGLPDNVWHKTCDNCHQWNRQSLCVQAKIYAKDPKMAFRKQHPYGGPEKIAMMNWAKSGCQ